MVNLTPEAKKSCIFKFPRAKIAFQESSDSPSIFVSFPCGSDTSKVTDSVLNNTAVYDRICT